MRAITRWLVAGALLAAPAAEAQVCNGFTSFSTAPLRLDGAVNFGEGATQFAGAVNFGRAQGAFGGVGAGFTSYDEVDGTSVDLAVNAGYQVPLGLARRAQLCPMVQAGASFGPEDISSQNIRFGGRVGGTVAMTPTTALVPFAGLDFAWARSEIDLGTRTRSSSDTYGILSLGAGLVLNQRVTLRPSVEIPLGLDDADPMFGIAVGIGFGR